jgi:hypothetical protein
VSPDCQNSKPAIATAEGNLDPQFILPVIPRCQEGLYSCWSTVTEMVVEFLSGQIVSQCQQSDAAFGLTDCCGPNGILVVDWACDSAWAPELEKWGYDYDSAPFPLDPDEVKYHINILGLPFAFAWTKNPEPTGLPTTPPGTIPQAPGESQADQVAHLLLAIGYGEDVKTKEAALVIIDPHPFIRSDAVIVPHHEYDGSDNSYAHAGDFVSFRPLQ